MHKFTRRAFVATVGVTTAGIATGVSAALAGNGVARQAPPVPRASSAAGSQAPLYRFFDAAEAQFIEAACERLIPADASGPGALAAGVPYYLDRQLGGAWGAGAQLYRSGPWQPGTPSRTQSLLTPAQLFRTALYAILLDFGRRGIRYRALPCAAQTEYLAHLEVGNPNLDGVPGAVFFDILLTMTVEGFFSNAACARGRDRVTWSVAGFPGAHAAASIAAS